jgi:hypothetical protein
VTNWVAPFSSRAVEGPVRGRFGRLARESARLRRYLRTSDVRRDGRRRDGPLGWARARVDDVAKRRRQELVVCRAALPVEGLLYARSSVTLAPAFLAGAPACWSLTIRL